MKTRRVEVMVDIILRSDNRRVKSNRLEINSGEVVMHLKSIQAVP